MCDAFWNFELMKDNFSGIPNRETTTGGSWKEEDQARLWKERETSCYQEENVKVLIPNCAVYFILFKKLRTGEYLLLISRWYITFHLFGTWPAHVDIKKTEQKNNSLKSIVCYLMQWILNAAQCFPNWSSSSSRWFSKVYDGFSTERATVPKPRPSILQETSQDTYCSGQQSGICIIFCNVNMKHEYCCSYCKY